MRRRAVLAILGAVSAVFLGSQTPACAQNTKITRVGVVASGSAITQGEFIDGLRQGLAEVGLLEGRNVVLDVRYASGRTDQLGPIAADLVSKGVDILFSGGDQATAASQRATTTIPIVAVTCDALAAGLVSNLAKPGGNLTGVTCINSDLSGKRVELLRETLPKTSVLGVTLDPSDRRMVAEFVEAQRAAAQHSIQTLQILMTEPGDIESGLAKAPKDGVHGVIVVFDSMLFFYRVRLAKAAIENRIPTIFNFRQFTDAGGLMSFGPNLRDMYRQSGRHFLKIIKGEAPGEIPMEQPTRFEWIINLKTAKAIGLTIPPPLLARADEVIE